MWPRKEKVRDWAWALLLWAALGASVGWYYTFTYFAGVGWPLPHPESLFSVVLYYFSALNVSAKVQAVHWLVTFPLSGVLWVSVLVVTAPFFDGRRAQFSYALYRFGVACLPLILAGPWLAYLAGSAGGGFQWDAMVDVALRRAWVTPSRWLNPVYAALAVAALAAQIQMYRVAFDVKGKKAWAHFLTSAMVVAVLACGLGTLAAIPLRAWMK